MAHLHVLELVLVLVVMVFGSTNHRSHFQVTNRGGSRIAVFGLPKTTTSPNSFQTRYHLDITYAQLNEPR